MADILDMKLSEVGFSTRLYNALTRREDSFYFTAPRTLGDLVSRTPKEVLRFGGIGSLLLKELDEKLASLGLALAPDPRPLKRYLVEKTPEQIEEERKLRENADLIKLHKALGKLMQNNHPANCFIALVSIVGQLLVAQFPEDDWEKILVQFSVDATKMAELLNGLMKEVAKEAEAMGGSSTVH